MAEQKENKFLSFITHNIIGAVAVIVVLMLVIPLPKVFIDFFMILNLALSIIILLIVFYTPRASAFSSFPRVILFATLFGLAINISSTRLILASSGRNINDYLRTQSDMVKAFANIVTGGNNVVIGMVIFIILVVVQVVVITKGAGRVSEVAARFTLDAMQVKQLDIDTQLSSGYISEEEARAQKEELSRDIDFYSNMDGSSKFVSGNVKAGVFITVVNLLGGFIVGMVMNKMDFASSLRVYSILTIGDGLMSQLPALMLSFATGILVTGDKSDEPLTEKVKREFSIDGSIYEIVGTVLALMGVSLRNGTQFLLVPVGALLFFVGFKIKQRVRIEEEQKRNEGYLNTAGVRNAPEADSVAPLDPLSLEIGFALVPLVDKSKGAELLERVTRIRREAALDLGLSVPRIRIMDNMNLDPDEYSFKIRGLEAGRSKIRLGYYMCMDTGTVIKEIPGEETRDPAFGLRAIWLPEEMRAQAESAGYTVVDPPTLIATHLTEIIRNHAAEILGRQEVATILNAVKETNPIVVDEVMNGQKCKFTYGDIEKILQGLLREQVSIRNMVSILEVLANYGAVTTNPWELIEKAREALGKQICMQYADGERVLRVVNLSQEWSEKILEKVHYPADGSRPFVAFEPLEARKWISAVSEGLSEIKNMGYLPVIMCSSVIRAMVRFSIEREMPGVVVISDKEVLAASSSVKLEVLGEIDYKE